MDDLRGDILEVGAGAGAMFFYYGEGANVVALEPDASFDTVVASTVLCSVTVAPRTGPLASCRTKREACAT